MSESRTQAEGDLDEGKDEDRKGDGEHVEVENNAGMSLTKHSTNEDELGELSANPNAMTLLMPNVALHSPSNIIGTPFATDSTPYEYPFPDQPSNNVLPFSSSLSSISPSPSFPSLSSGSSFPISSSSSLQLQSLSSNLPSVSLPHLAHFPLDLSQKHSSTHPKLRKGNPPVPPALVQKRQRWSLGLLRRRSSSGSSGSAGPSEASSDTASERVLNPLRLTHTAQEEITTDSQEQQNTVTEDEKTEVKQPD